jgi:hypothetical protein
VRKPQQVTPQRWICQIVVQIGQIPDGGAWRAGQLRVDRGDGPEGLPERRRRRPRNSHPSVFGGGGMTSMREQQRALGTEPLHQRACGEARFGGDLPQRQFRRAATAHDPHQRREYIGVLGLSSSWTHRP